MSSDKFKSFAFSSTGHSHIKAGKRCQDASAAFGSYNFSAAVVCDGHGGDKHFRSETGANIAVSVCKRAVRQVVRGYSRVKSMEAAKNNFRSLEDYIVGEWRAAVREHFAQNPFTAEELNVLQSNHQEKLLGNPLIAYGATCLLSVSCGNFLYLMQLGDGDIRVRKKGKFISPIPTDERLCCGVTTSLCDDNAVANIRDCVMPIDGVKYCWLSSDGVKNSFCDEECFNAFIATVHKEYFTESYSVFADEIKDYLPKLSKRGSGDDLSIACICKKKMRIK